MSLSRTFTAFHHRSFVSTVLLSRTWENETVVELRKEARARGLSTKGNKSTLVARIKEQEQNSVTATLPPVHTPGTTRNAATHAAPLKKTVQATAPGIPIDTAPPNPDFWAVKLPDLTPSPLNAPVQVPYVPDFWNSAPPKADAPVDLELPKLHVVSGSVTYYDGGPTHNLEKPWESGSPSTATTQADHTPDNKEVGFWPDLWESVGLPRSFSVRRSLSKAGDIAAQTGRDGSRTRSRPLTDEEKRGLYILLGAIGGSWLVGGLLHRPAAAVEEHGTRNQH